MRVALICSNDTHVKMFGPVAERLAASGAEPVLVPLDPFYDQGAEAAAERTGHPVVLPRWLRPRAAAEFYQRPTAMVWRDVVAARRPIDSLLRRLRPQRLVLGNDRGLIEKLLLERSRQSGVPVRILVQDGRLAERRPSPPDARAVLLGVARRVFSPALRTAGFGYLSASEYGEGGAELICAAGPRGAAVLGQRVRPRSRVVITGQPRYDRLLKWRREVASGPIETVALFTTPFAFAGLGPAAQDAQLAAVSALHEILAANGIDAIVKPHPRERALSYEQMLGDDRVSSEDPATLLGRADLAVIGISTVIEEAAIVGCPVIVPGRLIHEDRFESALPDPVAFPRFDTIDDGARLVLGLVDPAARSSLRDRQRAALLPQLTLDSDRPAAAAVADAILAA